MTSLHRNKISVPHLSLESITSCNEDVRNNYYYSDDDNDTSSDYSDEYIYEYDVETTMHTVEYNLDRCIPKISNNIPFGDNIRLFSSFGFVFSNIKISKYTAFIIICGLSLGYMMKFGYL